MKRLIAWHWFLFLSQIVLFLSQTLLFFAPVLIGWRTFPDGDFTHHFLSFALLQYTELLDARLPVWNPLTYSGHPFLADTQAAVFYPVSNLVLLASSAWASVGARLYVLQLEAILHVALAGWFVWLLVYELTGKYRAGVLAGVVFAFSGYLTGYPPLQLAILRTAIWLPLILFFLTRAFGRPQQWRWWLAAALTTVTAFLAGHPQTFLYSSYVVGAYCVFCSVQVLRVDSADAQRKAGDFRYSVIGLFLFVCFSLFLSAAQLLPSLEFTRYSVRANTDYAFVSGGFPLRDTWQIFLPAVLTQFSPLYVGVIGIGYAVLAIVFLLIGRKCLREQEGDQATAKLRPLIAFFFVLVVVALLLSYGENGFLYPFFYRFAPGWHLFRGQERAAYLVTFGVSVLAGFGAALVESLSVQWRQRLGLWIVALITAAVYAFGLLVQVQGQSVVSHERFLVLAAGTLLLATGMMILLRRPGWSERRQWLLIWLAFINLFAANVSTNLDQVGPTRKTILSPEMAALQAAVTERASANLGLPGRVYNEYRIYEDYGMRLQVEDVWGSSPLRSAYYARLFENFPLDRMWRLTGVEHVLTWRRELFGPSQLLGEFPQVSDTTFLHRLPQRNPRAWLVAEWQVADDDTAVTKLADHQFNLEQIALLPPESAIAPGKIAIGQSEIHLSRVAPNRLRVEMKSEQGGLLLLSEIWLPGWQLQIAGDPAFFRQQVREMVATSAEVTPPYFLPTRANLTLLGVFVPKGKVAFELVYAPASVYYGLLISGGALLILLVMVVWRLIHKTFLAQRELRRS